MSQRYGHTGRDVLGSEAERRAIEWAAVATRDEILNHPVAEEFRALIQTAPRIAGDPMTLFRGRGIRDGEPMPPSVDQMGPLPLSRMPQAGRYHREGERALYLADSAEGVRREMEAWFTVGAPYVIRVTVPVTSLRIADFCGLPADHLLTAAFARAELCNVPGRGPANYVFSQAVGTLVAESFDGMRIPGVRGEPGAHYTNLVLFGHRAEWPSWTDPANPPHRLGSATGPVAGHEEIAVAAYYLWEKEGRPHGRADAHWFQAIHELRASSWRTSGPT